MADERRENDAPDVRTMIGVGALPKPARGVPEPDESVLGLEVDLQRDADRANESLLGDVPPPAAAPEEDEPAVYRSPVVPQVSILRRVIYELDTFFAPPWTRQKKIVVGSLGGSLLFLLVCLLVRGPAKEKETSATTPTTSASATIASAPARADAHPRSSLRITADRPIASVTIVDRMVETARATTVDVELLEAERTKSLRVVIHGVDGRIAIATAESTTRGLDVFLEEEEAAMELPPPPQPNAAPQAQGATGAAPPAKDKRPWPKRPPRR
jgi:hypothetical protein